LNTNIITLAGKAGQVTNLCRNLSRHLGNVTVKDIAEMKERRSYQLGDTDVCLLHLALENEILRALTIWGEWRTIALQTFVTYKKLGGTKERKDFDEIVERGK